MAPNGIRLAKLAVSPPAGDRRAQPHSRPPKGRGDIADFFRIRELIAERAPDIEVFIADNESPCSVTRRQAARRPALPFTPPPTSALTAG
jgi:hypothetical protein